MLRLWMLLGLAAAFLHAGSVTVAAAANVGDALKELAREFERTHPEARIRVIVGSSGKLTAQIHHGAPYQIFLSADMGYPEALRRSGEAATEPRIYARGLLALFSRQKRDLTKGLALLKDPRIRRIAVANPRTAPYGRAAAAALKNAGLLKELRPRFVYGESVSQTAAYALGAADAGLIALSTLHTPRFASFKKNEHWIVVDPQLYRPIDQGAVLLKKGESEPEARAFYRFLFTPRSGEILRRYGYRAP
ncbi:molybdate ABC transporter substrate-binding protein [Nitratifractor sp.]